MFIVVSQQNIFRSSGAAYLLAKMSRHNDRGNLACFFNHARISLHPELREMSRPAELYKHLGARRREERTGLNVAAVTRQLILGCPNFTAHPGLRIVCTPAPRPYGAWLLNTGPSRPLRPTFPTFLYPLSFRGTLPVLDRRPERQTRSPQRIPVPGNK
jgi:hypothetical protein